MYAGLCENCLLFLANCTKHRDMPTELIKNPKYEIWSKFAVGVALFLAAVRTNGHDGAAKVVRTRLQTNWVGCVSFEVLTAALKIPIPGPWRHVHWCIDIVISEDLAAYIIRADEQVFGITRRWGRDILRNVSAITPVYSASFSRRPESSLFVN